jgi:hypothetical protein
MLSRPDEANGLHGHRMVTPALLRVAERRTRWQLKGVERNRKSRPDAKRRAIVWRPWQGQLASSPTGRQTRVDNFALKRPLYETLVRRVHDLLQDLVQQDDFDVGRSKSARRASRASSKSSDERSTPPSRHHSATPSPTPRKRADARGPGCGIASSFHSLRPGQTRTAAVAGTVSGRGFAR